MPHRARESARGSRPWLSGLFASAALWLAIVLLTPAFAAAAPAPAEPSAAVARARAALAEGRPDEARELLKQAVAAWPEAREARLLLAATYLTLQNAAWGVRTLSGWLEAHPTDCEARTLLAWAYLALGSSHAAASALEGACPDPGPLQPRADLLRALVAHASDGADAAPTRRAAYDRARGAPAAYPADRDALRALGRVLAPERLDDLSWSVDVSGGYTTDARLGAPSDPAARGADAGSGLLQTSLFLRATPDLGGPVRPAGEGQVRVLRFLASGAAEQSYLNLTGRVGVLVDWGLPRVTVGYRPDFLLLDAADRFGEAPLWYAEGHRGEIEVEVAPWLLVQAGGGVRRFRELGRSRHEADATLAGQAPLGARFRLAWALLGRLHVARDPVYDLLGASALVTGTTRVWRDATIRAGALLSFDDYRASGTFFGAEPRRDLFVRGTLAAWSPSVRGARLGLTYELSSRATTADAWAFSDHRVTLALRWGGAWSGGLPASAAGRPTVDVPWGLDPDQPDERVTDLLRLDEPVQNVCGCAQ